MLRTKFHHIIWLLAAVALLVCGGRGDSRAEGEALGNRLYVANLIRGSAVIFVTCADGAAVAVKPGQVHGCKVAANRRVLVGLPGLATAPLDVDRESNFALDLPASQGVRRLQGATETLVGLLPGKTDYFLYLWHLEEGE